MSDRYTPAEALDLLVDSFDGEPDGWNAIVADAAAESARRRGVRGIPGLRRGTRIRLGLLVAGAAAVAALIVTSPWKTTGPAGISDAQAAQILRNVQAATTPRRGGIVHMRVRTTIVWTPTRKGGRAYLQRSGEEESWEMSSPSLFLMRLHTSSQTLKQRPTITDFEWKITASATNGCRGYVAVFDSATKTIHPLYGTGIRAPYSHCARFMSSASAASTQDMSTGLRSLVANGELKVVARTRLDGEDVYRLDLCPSGGHCPSSTPAIYVDARSYRPVRSVSYGSRPHGGCSRRGYKKSQTIVDVTSWDDLPSTAANLALTDLRKQHPGASVSSRPSFHSPWTFPLRVSRGC